MEGSQVVNSSSDSMLDASGFEISLHTPNCGNSYAHDEQSTCTNMIKNIENTLQQQDSSCCSVLNKDNKIDEEVSVDDIFHIQNSHDQFAGCNWTSEKDKASDTEEISAYKELIPFDTIPKKCLRKSVTFPSFEVEPSLSSCTEIYGASSSTSVPIQNSLGDQLPTYKRSTSLPASSKPISALKGGRAQNGTLPMIDMRVKWAIDVYDPPTTLKSHTVKSNNHQRPKSKKKDINRNKKHNKSKNSRGNSSGKKLSNCGNVGSLPIPFPAKYTPPRLWLQAGGANGLVDSETGGKSAALEFAVVGVQDTKCGNNFLRESLAKLHLSCGEAA